MPTVVGVRLRFSKTLWFDPAETTPSEGDMVIVATDRGDEVGTVVSAGHDVEQSALPAPLKPIVRLADDDDLARAEERAAKEAEALTVFRESVERHRLDMKPVDVEYALDGDRITFFFSAEERVDFRELVKDLASRFHARVDMRQVGVRDEARAVGGIGHCGQMLCCVRFGGDFQPVSIRMAKEQDLPLNPLKISGLCGRLMCCLRYEYDAYKDFKTRAPKRGAIIETPSGLAKVSELNTPRESVRMRFEDGSSVTVPLSGMACGKGGTCPCSVTVEALEEATGVVAGGGLTDTMRPAKPERPERSQRDKGDRGKAERPAPEATGDATDDASEFREGGRRRRRRKSGGGSEQRQKVSGEQAGAAAATGAKDAPKPKPGAGAGKAAEGGEKQPRKRRRRRRSGGGGAGGGTPAG